LLKFRCKSNALLKKRRIIRQHNMDDGSVAVPFRYQKSILIYGR